jgi:hypothetical protein
MPWYCSNCLVQQISSKLLEEIFILIFKNTHILLKNYIHAMKKLLAFAQFVQKKPTDTTIRIIRVILPALTCIALGISSDATSYTFGYFFASYEPIMEQVIAGIFLIPALVFGGF